jgi:hypothetical protein
MKRAPTRTVPGYGRLFKVAVDDRRPQRHSVQPAQGLGHSVSRTKFLLIAESHYISRSKPQNDLEDLSIEFYSHY